MCQALRLFLQGQGFCLKLRTPNICWAAAELLLTVWRGTIGLLDMYHNHSQFSVQFLNFRTAVSKRESKKSIQWLTAGCIELLVANPLWHIVAYLLYLLHIRGWHLDDPWTPLILCWTKDIFSSFHSNWVTFRQNFLIWYLLSSSDPNLYKLAQAPQWLWIL